MSRDDRPPGAPNGKCDTCGAEGAEVRPNIPGCRCFNCARGWYGEDRAKRNDPGLPARACPSCGVPHTDTGQDPPWCDLCERWVVGKAPPMPRPEGLVQGPEPERYGFWEYDLFPGLLSGRVLKGPHANGKCHIEGFEGFSFTCVAIVEGERGRQLHERLREMTRSHDEAVRAMNAAWKALGDKLRAEIKGTAGG